MVGTAPTGYAPTISQWSIVLLPPEISRNYPNLNTDYAKTSLSDARLILVSEYRPYNRYMHLFSPTGHPVNVIFLLQVPMHGGQLLVSISSPVPLSNAIHHLEKSDKIVITTSHDFSFS